MKDARTVLCLWTMLVVLAVESPLSLALQAQTNSWLLVAQCRARCGDEFLSSNPDSLARDCFLDESCNECWIACGTIAGGRDVLQDAVKNPCNNCTPTHCPPACEYIRDIEKASYLSLGFKQQPKMNYKTATLKWSPPNQRRKRPKKILRKSGIPIYVLIGINGTGGMALQDMSYQREYHLSKFVSGIRLIAVNMTHVLANTTIHFDENKLRKKFQLGVGAHKYEYRYMNDIDEIKMESYDSPYLSKNDYDGDYTDEYDAEYYAEKLHNFKANLTLIPEIYEGSMTILVSWKSPLDYADKQIVVYSEQNCGCPPLSKLVYTQDKKKSQVISVRLINGIKYHADYAVSVFAMDMRSEEITVMTPQDVGATEDSPISQNTDPTVWKIRPFCASSSGGSHVVLGLEWDALSVGHYTVYYNSVMKSIKGNADEYRHGKLSAQNSTEAYLHLRANVTYKIKIKAMNNQSHVYTSEELKYDTTDPMNQTDNCSINPFKAGTAAQRSLNTLQHDTYPLLIALASVSGFFVLSATLLLIYKKRHSFREIIITKSTVAKSNSYKSTLGGSTDGIKESQLLVVKDEWELDPKDISLGSELGQGAFGRVLVGYHKDQKVAIKVLKEEIAPLYRDDLIREITLLKKIGCHLNIVKVIGACTISEPIALVMEYMPYGNLQEFLRKCQAEGEVKQSQDGSSGEINYSVVNEQGQAELWNISGRDMLSFARQIILAMEFLSEKNYVHRDLAARNVLVGYSKVVKICDFGLARVVYTGGNYYRMTNGRLPVKWMALESLKDRKYTIHSDVWAFGILLWEIVTMGSSPYPDIPLVDLYQKLCDGYRMQQPTNCSDEIYDVMSQCWYETPTDRPSFSDLRRQVESLLSQSSNYLVLGNLGIPSCSSDGDSGTFQPPFTPTTYMDSKSEPGIASFEKTNYDPVLNVKAGFSNFVHEKPNRKDSELMLFVRESSDSGADDIPPVVAKRQDLVETTFCGTDTSGITCIASPVNIPLKTAGTETEAHAILFDIGEDSSNV